MNKNDQEFLVQKIRTQYTEKEHTQLDSLKALDKKVKKPANIFAYTFGTIGALVMGSGMSLAMNVIEPGTYFGITIDKKYNVPWHHHRSRRYFYGMHKLSYLQKYAQFPS